MGRVRVVREDLGCLAVQCESVSSFTNFLRKFRIMDQIDSQILAALQADASLTAQQMGERFGLSPSQVARRRQRLEALGVIAGYGARLSPGALGLGVQAFVQVQMARHSPEGARSFASLIATLSEVAACWTLTGEADYLLRVWCADLAALNRLIQERLLAHPAVGRVQSQIVMEQGKADSGFPV